MNTNRFSSIEAVYGPAAQRLVKSCEPKVMVSAASPEGQAYVAAMLDAAARS